jgi:hypothetical protein
MSTDALVVQETCSDGDNQLWSMDKSTPGTKLRVKHSNMCLNVKDPTTAGANTVIVNTLQQYTCGRGSSELWKLG